MVHLTTLKGEKFYLNAELIEKIEEFPDTLITLIGGKKVRVHERAEDVVKEIIYYKRNIHCYKGEVKK